ncbi:DUF2484 family protein [Palleronia pelagia]|uniref:UDP-N-acetylmuramate--alanine ligase n=1 Tax=Palleronia pelagia TaxID=387096 RepID=A0A1H8KK64_9RHOB|nr:DUF2484 family protein [Palleronia pelagia]SEN93217.1 Protein of unknown function [Palleronia pelagia]
MSVALVLGCLWVVAASLVALLPSRRQRLPAGLLVLLAPGLLALLALAHGIWVTLASVAAVVSIFRRPLSGAARKAEEALRHDNVDAKGET